MKNNKALGRSGLMTDMLKNLPEIGYSLITKIIEYWTSDKCDFKLWHIQKLRTQYKGKGETIDLNNWRGICLKESMVKIISIIHADRLLAQLKISNAQSQLGTLVVRKHCTLLDQPS